MAFFTFKGPVLISAVLAGIGCQDSPAVSAPTSGSKSSTVMPEAGVYSLYRNSVTDSTARYYIGVFDAPDGDKYNRENCEVARSLFQDQPGVLTHFWCQPGRAE